MCVQVLFIFCFFDAHSFPFKAKVVDVSVSFRSERIISNYAKVFVYFRESVTFVYNFVFFSSVLVFSCTLSSSIAFTL